MTNNARLNPKLIVCIIYVATMFMVAMDANILNVALRTIGSEFGMAPSSVGVINVSYLVSLAVVLPAAGWLGDRFGTKRMFLLAISMFTVSSALCGLSANLETLSLFRVIQGASGGMLTPVAMTILFRTFPPQERAKLSRYLVFPIALAPAFGPILGGFFVDYLTWRWVFFVNIPIGAAAVVFAMAYLSEHRQPDAGRLDWLGLALAAPGFGMLVYALHQGAAEGWAEPVILMTGIAGALLIAALVFVQLRTAKPLLDLRLFGDRLFRTMVLISVFTAAGLLGMLYVFPLLYQDALGASAFDSGLTTFPEALGLMLASQVVPWTYNKLGPRRLITIALIASAGLYALLCEVGASTSPWWIRALMLLCGFCLGHVVSSVQFSVFANIPPASMGRASTLFTMQNRLSSGLGLAVIVSILAAAGTGSSALPGEGGLSIEACRIALYSAAGFLLIACLFAQRIRAADVELTLQKRKAAAAAKPGSAPAAANPQAKGPAAASNGSAPAAKAQKMQAESS